MQLCTPWHVDLLRPEELTVVHVAFATACIPVLLTQREGPETANKLRTTPVPEWQCCLLLLGEFKLVSQAIRNFKYAHLCDAMVMC